MNWQTMTLGDVVTLKRGHDLPERDRREGSVPIVSSSGITGFHNIAKAEPPGVVTGRYGTLGEVYFINEPYWPLNTSLYAVNFHENDPKFVSYFLRQVLKGASSNSKAAVPGVNRNDLHALKVRVPDRNVQERIAGILSAYDDLIENNRRRIKLLEEVARLIYREWFARLHFQDHEQNKIENGLPEGWAKKPFDDIADVSFGYAFKSNLFTEEEIGRPIIRIRDVVGGNTRTYTPEEASEDRLVFDGDLLVGMDGEFHMGFWSGGTAWLNQRVCRISGKNGVSTGLLRYVLEKSIRFFNDTNVGTTVTHLSAKDIRSIEAILPSGALLEEVSGILESFRLQSVVLRKQNRRLAKARDLLLPRLMSGEIEV